MNTLGYLLSMEPITYKIDRAEVRKIIMDYAVAYITIDGVVLEFGVAKGITARHLISSVKKDTPIFLFDSFEGLPEDWVGYGPKKGTFKQNVIPVFEEPNVIVVKGLFEDTLPILNLNKNIALIHIDCDIYSSTKTIFEYLNNRIIPGTLLLFDEFYNYPAYEDHECKAFLEWIEIENREFIFVERTLKEQVLIRIIK